MAKPRTRRSEDTGDTLEGENPLEECIQDTGGGHSP